MAKGIRFTDELKQDAVAQVVKRGYAASELDTRHPTISSTNNATYINTLHQPSHGAACDTELFALQLVPDFWGAINVIIIFPNTLDFGAKNRVSFGTVRGRVRISGNGIITERRRRIC